MEREPGKSMTCYNHLKFLENKIKFLLYIWFGCIGYGTFGAKVDTITTYSAAMKKDIKAVVITPDQYEKAIPVVYLLHGYSGNYKSWISKVPSIEAYADQNQLMIVCPDGGYGSWYFDSLEQSDVRYETYIISELIPWIDTHYNTIKNKTGRAITGFSMGGHGAFFLSFKYQDVFSIAGSMSGGVDLRPFPEKWDISKVLGTYAEHPDRWENHSVINNTHFLTPSSLNLIFSCGVDDFFYEVNKNLHEKLLLNNIPHTFISAPGGHTWEFWETTLKYHMEFIYTKFEQHITTKIN